MFKNFLTQQFALNFERACQSQTDLPIPIQNELLRCAKNLVHHFTLGTHATSGEEACRGFFVALTYLRDCRQTLIDARVDFSPLQGPYEVLEGRLEKLCWESCKTKAGQLRMLG